MTHLQTLKLNRSNVACCALPRASKVPSLHGSLTPGHLGPAFWRDYITVLLTEISFITKNLSPFVVILGRINFFRNSKSSGAKCAASRGPQQKPSVARTSPAQTALVEPQNLIGCIPYVRYDHSSFAVGLLGGPIKRAVSLELGVSSRTTKGPCGTDLLICF